MSLKDMFAFAEAEVQEKLTVTHLKQPPKIRSRTPPREKQMKSEDAGTRG